MKRSLISKLIILGLALVIGGFASGCSTVAQTEFYRPANHQGDPIRISGKFEPDMWTGTVFIYVNDQEILKKRVPAFSTSTEVKGTWEGKNITVVLTRVTSFVSSYVKAEVFFGSEKATTLTF